MATPPSMFLHWVNVVILAEFHNPSILNPDFLERNEIVPPDWKAVEVLTTPAFSNVKYANNTSFFIDRERLEVKRECGGEFLENYNIHDIASNYLNILPHVRYTTVGLNWQTSIENEAPEKIISERFLKEEAWKESGLTLLNSSVNLSFEVETAICNLNFVSGQANLPDKKFNAVIISANFHYKGPFSVGDLDNILKKWKSREDFLRDLIPKLVGEIS